MNFKVGDRVHVTKLKKEDVDFYATLKRASSSNGHLLYRLKNCTNSIYENDVVWKESSNFHGVRDYYTLATDEEDTEEPIVQRIEVLDKGEIIAQSILSNRDGDSFTSAHDMIMWLNEIESMHGENINVKGWSLIFDHVKNSIAPAFFDKE